MSVAVIVVVSGEGEGDTEIPDPAYLSVTLVVFFGHDVE